LLLRLSFDAIQCFLYLRQVLCSGSLKRFNSFALKMAAPSPTIASKPLILCVEDNEIYLRPRKAVLEQAGYAVLSASTGTEAMEILRDAPVCLVLSDHMLRGTTGTFLAKQMKKIKRMCRSSCTRGSHRKPCGMWTASSTRMSLCRASCL